MAPKRSTLAYANEHQPWELYQTVFEQTLDKCQELVRSQGGRKKFRFKNKLMSLDGSIIDLSVSMFDGQNSGGRKVRSSCTCCWAMMATCRRSRW